jgi:hypothetical protein
MKSKSINSNIESSFLINMWLLYFPANLFVSVVPFFMFFVLGNTKIHFSILMIPIILFGCALWMTFSLNKNIRTIEKDDKDTFIYCFFRKDYRIWIPLETGLYNAGEGGFINFFLAQISCAILSVNFVFVAQVSISGFNLIYISWYIIINIFMIIFIVLIIIGKKKTTKIYGKIKKIKHKKRKQRK